MKLDSYVSTQNLPEKSNIIKLPNSKSNEDISKALTITKPAVRKILLRASTQDVHTFHSCNFCEDTIYPGFLYEKEVRLIENKIEQVKMHICPPCDHTKNPLDDEDSRHDSETNSMPMAA